MSKNITQITKQNDDPTCHLPRTRFDIIVEHDDIINELIEEELVLKEDLDSYFSHIKKFQEGGQGIIKTARDKKLHRYVALKSLKKDFHDNPDVVKKFISEARITAQLDHPSIIPMYGLLQDKNSFIHMAMKLVQGRTLSDLIKETSIIYKNLKHSAIQPLEHQELKVRLSYFVKICEAISYAHSKNIIHKDLKPENIMIGSFNEVYVMDWGISEVYNKKTNANNNSERKFVVGTPMYIAPEYILSGESCFSCDLYALGVILHEIVCLQGPIDADDQHEIFKQTLRGIYPPIIHKFNHLKIHRELQAIICKAMALDPKQRYSSIGALGQDIINHLQKEEVIALKDNFLRATIRKIYKHKLIATIIFSTLLLSFASITIWSLIEQKQVIEQSKQRELRLINFQTNLNQRAALIDRHFLSLCTTLNRFSDQIKYLLRNNSQPNQKILFVDSLNFNQQISSIPGINQSPLYGGNVSLIRGNFKIPPDKNIKLYTSYLKKLSPLVTAGLNVMASSPDIDAKLDDSMVQQALTLGYPIRSMYAGFNNGLLIKYPATDTISQDYTVSSRFWYQHAKQRNSIFWSAPYPDLFGQGLVISAIKPLRYQQGSFLGAAAIDITFDFIMDNLMEANKDYQTGIKRNRYLIDQNGKVILTNRKNMSNLNQALKDKTEIQFYEFHYPHIIPTIKNKKSGQIRFDLDGQETLIAFCHITTLNWFYIEELDMNSLLK